MRLKTLLATSKDFALNIAASLLSTGVMQLVLYPTLAKSMTPAEYGEMLTVIGVLNVVLLAFGNNLSYSRLLVEKEYAAQKKYGDFQLLALLMAMVSGAIMLVANVYFRLDAAMAIAIAIATAVSVWKAYYIVTYRIKLEYGKNLIVNIWISIGYIVGAFVLIRYVSWPWVFTLSSLAGLIYIWFSSDIMREPYCVTPLFKRASKVVFWLLLSGLMGNLTTYLDRFILHPLLGSESVSVYSTAAFFSKSINLMLSPITTVLLSYLTNGKLKLNKRLYVLINGGVIAMSAFFLLITVVIGDDITALLYPSLFPLSEPYFLLSSLGIVMGIAGSFMGVPVMAYAPAYWQTVMAAVKLVMYFVFGIVLTNMWGITGMCVGVLLTNLGGNIFSFILGYRYVNTQE